jgi:hypothetical protein
VKSIDNGGDYFSNNVHIDGTVRVGKHDDRIKQAKGYVEYTKQ